MWHVSRTAKIWVDYLIRPVFIMTVYVRAERVGDWPLHILAMKIIMPYIFAAGHINMSIIDYSTSD